MMERKRSLKKAVLSAAFAAVMLVAAIPLNALAASSESRGLQPPILQGVQREIKRYEQPLEISHGEYAKAPQRAMNTRAKEILNEYGIDPMKTQSVEVIEETSLNRTVKRVEFETARADFDEKGNLVDYINYEDIPETLPDRQTLQALSAQPEVYVLQDQRQLAPIIADLEEQFQLQDYVLIQCDTTVHDSVWTLTWYKDCGNGLFNPYDNLTAFIDAKDGSFMTMGRNTMEPNTTNPIVTEQQAIEFAQPVADRFSGVGQTTAKLTYFRPNFYWENNRDLYKEADFIRLAWEIKLDDVAYIYVDALSGEILGGNQTQSASARAMCAQPNFYGAVNRVNWASDYLKRWGYTEPYGFQPHNGYITEADVRWVLEYNGCTGIYLLCHGASNYPSGIPCIAGNLNANSNSMWTIYANTVDEVFHFVFLDACESSATNSVHYWLDAFHIGGNGSMTAFIGWNISVYTTVATDFCNRFWPKTDQYTLYNSLILAMKESREIYGVECNPGFYGDTYYYGGAW